MSINFYNYEDAKKENSKNEATPFILWVGGKTRVLDKLLQLLPKNKTDVAEAGAGSCENINELSKPNYYEPFLGSGALFFSVKDKFNKCYLSDINLDLITSYHTIRTQPIKVLQYYTEMFKNHSGEFYYKLRQKPLSSNPIHITARFLYINRYSFKGIYCINSKGEFSASFSTRSYNQYNFNKKILVASKALGNAKIYASDFSFITPCKGDLVYLDPPYHKSGEKFYTWLPFDENEQIRLRDFVKDS